QDNNFTITLVKVTLCRSRSTHFRHNKPPSLIEKAKRLVSFSPQLTHLSITGAIPPFANNFSSYIIIGMCDSSCSKIHLIVSYSCLNKYGSGRLESTGLSVSSKS